MKAGIEPRSAAFQTDALPLGQRDGVLYGPAAETTQAVSSLSARRRGCEFDSAGYYALVELSALSCSRFVVLAVMVQIRDTNIFFSRFLTLRDRQTDRERLREAERQID